MPCSKCGATTRSSQQPQVVRVSRESLVECEYTVDIMKTWLLLLKCVKKTNLYDQIGYSKFRINVATGIVQSAINTNNPCYFQSKLFKVNDIILAIVNFAVC